MRSVLALFLSLLVFLPAQSLAFDDITDKAVERLAQKKVIEEKTRFLPDIPCAKGVFVEWALKNINEDVSGKKLKEPFVDVKPTDRFAPFAARAFELGVVKGTAFFEPQKTMTRLEALSIALKLEGVTIPVAGFNPPNYADIPKDPATRGTIVKAIELGLMTPKNEKIFGVASPMTRLECAELLDAVSLSRKSEQFINVKIGGEKDSKSKDSTFDEVLHTLQTKYLHAEKLDDNVLMETAIKEMVESLEDPYTIYFDEQEVNDFLLNVGVGTQYGIGAQVGLDKDLRTIIVKPLPESPAEKAGLKPGDVILKVDGIDVSSGESKLEEVVKLIKGEEGTKVKIEFERNQKSYQLEIVRAPIVVESVYASERNGYLLIEMHFFGNDTVQKVKAAIDAHPTAAKKGIILDLRDNPGGFLDTAVELLGLFLPAESVAVKTKGRDLFHTEEVKGSGEFTANPLIVIVNERSASASEIVAGALQDNKRAIIIGKTTFGKGTAQELLQFKDGTALKVTIAEWLTPDERNIDGTGIAPDTFIEDTDNDEAIWDQAARMIGRGQWKTAK